jgi:feruloyl-CoA synthase
VRSGWTPDPFATRVERRADGSLLLTPTRDLGRVPERLVDSLEHWARLAPDRLLVARRGKDGAWRGVSYGAMLSRVRRCAAGLLERRLSAERPIAILSGNSIEHLTLALAAMWVGIPYCPVSPAYAHAGGDLSRLRYVLDLLTPGLVAAFDTPRFSTALRCVADDVEVVGDEPVDGRRVTTLDSLESADSGRVDRAHGATNADSIVRLLLTSGSTGNPKAVITTHRMCCSNAAMLKQALPFVTDEPPVLLDWLPWNHTFGGSHNIGLVLTYGGTLHIDDGRPTADGIAETLRNLREISPTIYFNVPKGFEMIAPHLLDDAVLRASLFKRLRAYFFGGASLAQRTWDQLDLASERELGYRTPMLCGLGATETGPSVTFTTPGTARSGVIGLPAAGAIAKLAAVDEKLELRVKGPAVTPGYWRDPSLTEAAFDPDGFYRLGDAVRLIDPGDPARGMMFDGRIGEDFKLRNGTWVSAGPLRAQLLAQCAPVAQDVVLVGLDEDFIAALIVADTDACRALLEGDRRLSRAELARHATVVGWLQRKLAEHARSNPASTRRVRRAMFLPDALSLDRGEITDKGSVNQRAVLRHHAARVAELYVEPVPGHVAAVD